MMVNITCTTSGRIRITLGMFTRGGQEKIQLHPRTITEWNSRREAELETDPEDDD